MGKAPKKTDQVKHTANDTIDLLSSLRVKMVNILFFIFLYFSNVQFWSSSWFFLLDILVCFFCPISHGYEINVQVCL